MGLFGFGGRSKVDKHVKKLTNAYVQSNERVLAMEKLAEDGSDEAVFGLLKRFTFRTEASITDEDEKQTAFQLLVGIGPAAVPAIERFVKEQEAVYWPLKALREIAGADMAVDLLFRALDEAELKDIRKNEHRLQIVSNLRDFPHERVRERLKAMCSDEDEEVRTLAIDGLMTYGEDVAMETIVDRLLDPEESARIKTVVLEQLIELAWPLDRWREALEADGVLPHPYQVGASGKMERGI